MQVRVSLDSTYLPFDARSAAKGLAQQKWMVPQLARQMRDACRPISRDDLTKRLTALGMMMAPNRPSAEATVWLHEMSRLLADLPKDILFHAVDECQRRARFLPTVAEIRDVAGPLLAERKTNAARLEAICVAMDEPDQPQCETGSRHLCTPEQAENALKEFGLLDAVRGGQSAKPIERGPARKPTRQDYLDMGVDPAVLDKIEVAK